MPKKYEVVVIGGATPLSKPRPKPVSVPVPIEPEVSAPVAVEPDVAADPAFTPPSKKNRSRGK